MQEAILGLGTIGKLRINKVDINSSNLIFITEGEPRVTTHLVHVHLENPYKWVAIMYLYLTLCMLGSSRFRFYQ